MAYIRFTFDTKKLKIEPYINIYPLPCMHIGAAQCDMEFLKDHLGRIEADPNARVVYMGDGGECVTKYSKGEIYKQLCSPQRQQDIIVDLLDPIKDKILFGIRGNHGNRIFKETGLSFDKTLCTALGVQYLGPAAMANIVVNRSSYDAYFHHGIDSGVSLSTKIAKATAFGAFISADAIFTAHSHVAIDLQPAALIEADNVNARTKVRMRHQYICGSAYDSRTGYAEEKGYPPLLPSYIVVGFDGRVSNGHARYGQESHVWRSGGERDLRHYYPLDYLDTEEN